MQQPTGQFVYINGGAGLQQPMPQNVGPQQRQQYIVVIPAPMGNVAQTQAYANYNKGASRVFGIFQIIIAVILCGLNIGIAVVNMNSYWVISTGWWATPFMVLAGSFGIAAGSRPSSCTVATTMVLSIVSCLCVISVIVQGALTIAVGCDYYYSYNCYNAGEIANIVMASIFIVVGIAEFFFALSQSILCCQGCASPHTLPANQFAPVQNGYNNGGFVPCYIHPQTPGQQVGQFDLRSVNMQNPNMAFLSCQTGENNFASAQSGAMAAAPTGGATSEAVPPPAYSKGQEAGY